MGKEYSQADLDALAARDGRLVYWIFLLMGTGLLFPWNTIITAVDYFSVLYPSHHVNFAFGLAYNIPSIPILLLLINYGSKFSSTVRSFTAFTVYALVLISFPILPLLGLEPGTMYSLTLFGVLLTGISGATLFGDLFGLAANFTPAETQAIMAGNGVAGLAVAIIRLVTKASLPETPVGIATSALIYFLLAAAVVVSCILGLYILLGLPYTKAAVSFTKSKQSDSTTALLSDDHTGSLLEQGGEKKAGNQSSSDVTVRSVLKKVWPMGASVTTTFFITLSLFPGLTADIPSTSDDPDHWFPVMMISTFLLFDSIGRAAPNYTVLLTPKTIIPFIVARLAFFPLFIFCVQPRLIASDTVAVVLMIIFATTNGYLGSLCMMFGPTLVSDAEKPMAGTIMTTFLNTGIFSGVFFALVVLYIVTGELAI